MALLFICNNILVNCCGDVWDISPRLIPFFHLYNCLVIFYHILCSLIDICFIIMSYCSVYCTQNVWLSVCIHFEILFFKRITNIVISWLNFLTSFLCYIHIPVSLV